MREHSGPLFRIETHGDKCVSDGVGVPAALPVLETPSTLDSVIPAQWGIEVQLVRQEQLPVIRRWAPHHRFHEVVQGGPQILHQFGIESGIGLGISGDLIGRIRVEPVIKEPTQLGLGPRVLNHASGLGADLFRSGDFTAVCGPPEGLVRE